ncbi:MAG: trypsin-like peptidase domain-containing protein [Verrucomicrobiales bacterium]|nr:trypsin-like peptidase domain-containing protein [Verrucomicrobiales bacterium]
MFVTLFRLSSLCLLIVSQVHGEEESPKDDSFYEAIVRIENTSQKANYSNPWNNGSIRRGSGTGFLIGKNRFLTNAHVVSDSRLVYLKKRNDPKPYKAKILHIAHDCDLALLALEDPSAFEKVPPLYLGGIPKLDTTVRAIGYPVGGDRMSITRGVVSRIEFNTYTHSRVDSHLSIQVDAAINPGNSGGPVVQNGKVVGVAFQGYNGSVAQNTGYMIPVPVIDRFLKDVGDGEYDQYVDLGISEFNLLNPAQRRALGLQKYEGLGVMVGAAYKAGSAEDTLQVGDVLIEIDGLPIASDGFVTIGADRVNMSEVVERKFRDETVQIKFIREGKEQSGEIKLRRFDPAYISGNNYEVTPRYILLAGLLFQPLDRNMYAAHKNRNLHQRYIYNYYSTDGIYEERPEVVVLTSILPDEVNTHFSMFEDNVVDKINGVTIKTLQQAYDSLHPEEMPDFHVIEFIGSGRPLVLETDRVEKAHQRILDKYNVTRDHYLEKPEKG